MMNDARSAIVALAFIAALATAAHANVIHVPADYPTIQQAIDAAKDGDEIIVAPGTYFENINLLGKAVHLRSADGPAMTVMHGQENLATIMCASGEGPATVIEGFTVHNAPAHPSQGAAGMRNIGSSPTIVNCRFVDLVGGDHTAMLNDRGGPTIIGSHFEWHFRAMHNVDSTVTITNCSFEFTLDGGAIWNGNSDVTIDGSEFTKNHAHCGVGGVTQFGGRLAVTNSTFINNMTDCGDDAAAIGVSWSAPETTITIENSTFINNWGQWGGAVRGATSIVGSTFIGNTSELSGGAVELAAGGIVQHSVFIGNDSWLGSGALTVLGPAIILNCTFESNAGDVANKSHEFDPIGAITTWTEGVEIGFSTFCDNSPTHIGGPWTNLGGNQFGPHCPVGDLTGNGKIGVADLLVLLGAWGACPDCDVPGDCSADLTGDCNVGVADLLILLANWG